MHTQEIFCTTVQRLDGVQVPELCRGATLPMGVCGCVGAGRNLHHFLSSTACMHVLIQL